MMFSLRQWQRSLIGLLDDVSTVFVTTLFNMFLRLVSSFDYTARHQILGAFIDVSDDLKSVWMHRREPAKILATEAIRTVKVRNKRRKSFFGS
jgi:hypothetical protein